MREILSEIIRQSIGLFDTVKITGTEDNVKIEAISESKTLFLRGFLNPSTDFIGQFALTNLPMLNGLLDFASYKTEGSKFIVKRDTKPKVGETVVAFHFLDSNGTGAKFATMNPELMKSQAIIGKMDWEIELTPSKAKITEFTQLTSLYKAVDDTFRATVSDGNLLFNIGDNHDATHNANMIFAANVTGHLSKDIMKWNSGLFLSILKAASLNGNPPKMMISGRGPLGVSLTTSNGTYDYVLRPADSEKKR